MFAETNACVKQQTVNESIITSEKTEILFMDARRVMTTCSSAFEISFNRQQLADYLSVDRSAMSNELCKLRDEGVLWFDKNRFKLL